MNAQPMYGAIQPNHQYNDNPVPSISWLSVILVFMAGMWFLLSIIQDGMDIYNGSDIYLNSLIMISKLSMLSIVVYWIVDAVRAVEPIEISDNLMD